MHLPVFVQHRIFHGSYGVPELVGIGEAVLCQIGLHDGLVIQFGNAVAPQTAPPLFGQLHIAVHQRLHTEIRQHRSVFRALPGQPLRSRRAACHLGAVVENAFLGIQPVYKIRQPFGVLGIAADTDNLLVVAHGTAAVGINLHVVDGRQHKALSCFLVGKRIVSRL